MVRCAQSSLSYLSPYTHCPAICQLTHGLLRCPPVVTADMWCTQHSQSATQNKPLTHQHTLPLCPSRPSTLPQCTFEPHNLHDDSQLRQCTHMWSCAHSPPRGVQGGLGPTQRQGGAGGVGSGPPLPQTHRTGETPPPTKRGQRGGLTSGQRAVRGAADVEATPGPTPLCPPPPPRPQGGVGGQATADNS